MKKEELYSDGQDTPVASGEEEAVEIRRRKITRVQRCCTRTVDS